MSPNPAAFFALLLFGVVFPASAQRWYLNSGIDADIARTSNANYGLTNSVQADTILRARPYVNVRADGGRMRLNGFASLEAMKYVNETQSDRLMPQGDLSAWLEAIERLFFIEAGVSAGQTVVDPFGPRPGASSNANTLTTTQWRLSPYFESVAGADLEYLVRSDHAWTRESGSDVPSSVSAANSYYAHDVIRLGREPRPFGWRFSAQRNETRYADANAVQDSAIDAIARLAFSYALGADWSAGVHVGAERNNYTIVRETQSLYGIEARWRPSERTDLYGIWEDRYFGPAWRVGFTHRRPSVAWNLYSSRDVSTTPQSLFELPPTNNVTALLDAMFTTRFPDPVARAKAVQDFVDRQGLPTSTAAPVTLYASRLSVVTSNTATATLIGTRNTVSLSVFRVRTEDLVDSVFALGTASANNIQHGASIAFTHALGPTTGVSAIAGWSHISALDDFGDSDTKETAASIRLNHQLALRTAGYAALTLRRIQSTVAATGRETTAVLGLNHTF